MSLTDMQEAFIDYYIITKNATEAAKLAGYSGTRNTLAVVGHENLRKPKIKKRISARFRERAMTADEALSILGDQARGDMGEIIAAVRNGSLAVEDWNSLKEVGLTHLVREVRETKYGLTIKLYSSQKALEIILREQGAFDHNATGTEDDPQHVVTHTRDEWLQRQQEQREQAHDAKALLDETDDDA